MMQRKTEDMENAAATLLRSGPLTPDDLSAKLKISWGTAQNVLLRLTSKGVAMVYRKGRVNVYILGSQVPSGSHAPSWAKPKDLGELSDELMQYFPKTQSAAEMIRKERGRS